MGIVLTAALNVVKRILLKMATEKFLEWGFFFFGEMIVKSTKTTKDDEFLAKVKEVYGGKDE